MEERESRTALRPTTAASTSSRSRGEQPRSSLRPHRVRSQPPPGSAGTDTLISSDISKQNITVCVRLRPLSQREEQRGDIPVWTCDEQKNICITKGVGTGVPKYAFDNSYGEDSTNYDIYEQIGASVVEECLRGFHGTVFAYGVTSSGKTHTMLGHRTEPGLVPQAVQHVFKIIKRSPDRAFLLRLSMLEIYNEVINDLLDPSNANLRLRDDVKGSGFYVDNLKELEVLSADHALSLVAMGDAQRKVSATSYNDDSSRSHTICRLTIESCKSTVKGPQRLFSTLNLIDLAGSESARAASTRSHRMEGSYINKSLLTLGTVISKLSDGNAAHIPFRDSKLTRLLQASLSGTGARVAVVCCITPAAAQAEETHNTLKFATRAKSVKIVAAKNELLDEKSMIVRYQKEIMTLRKKLEHVMATKDSLPPEGQAPEEVKSMKERMHVLREELEEEKKRNLSRETEKAALEARIGRLTRIVLNSTRALLQTPTPARSSVQSSTVSPLASREVNTPTQSNRGGFATPRHAPDDDDVSITSQHSRRSSLAYSQIRSVGDIHPGTALSLYDFDSPYVAENEVLRDHLRMLTEEMETRGLNVAFRPDMPGTGLATPSGHGDSEDRSDTVGMSDGVTAMDGHATSARDARNLMALQNGLQELKGSAKQTAQFAAVATAAAAEGGDVAVPSELWQRLQQTEQHVQSMVQQLEEKDKQLARERRMLDRFRELEQQIEMQLRAVTQDNQRLRTDLSRSEQQTNHLQGYALDDLSHDGLQKLVGGLTQALERVRITLQLRDLTKLSKQGSRSATSTSRLGLSKTLHSLDHDKEIDSGFGACHVASTDPEELLRVHGSGDSEISTLRRRPSSQGISAVAMRLSASGSKAGDLTASRVERGLGGRAGQSSPSASSQSASGHSAARGPSPRSRIADVYRRIENAFDIRKVSIDADRSDLASGSLADAAKR